MDNAMKPAPTPDKTAARQRRRHPFAFAAGDKLAAMRGLERQAHEIAKTPVYRRRWLGIQTPITDLLRGLIEQPSAL